MIQNKFLQGYKENGFDAIEGWCSPKLFQVIDFLDNTTINKQGGCLEIGVHHGKFYMMLNSVIEPIYKSFALDVFDDQDLNIDSSGRGNLEVFKSNLERYDRHRGFNTEIVRGDSTDLRVTRCFNTLAAPFRFISIDGGHTAEHTVSDLILATTLIANEGVVILDDILNPHWLGVIEGAVAFLNQKPTLIPFAIGSNKLFLAKLTYKSQYFELLSKSPYKSKIVNFFGHPIVAL